MAWCGVAGSDRDARQHFRGYPMDQQHVAAWTRSLTRIAVTRLPSRRDVLRGLVGLGLGLSALRRPETADAKKKRKKRKKHKKKRTQSPPQPLPPPALNAFGCVDVGQACRGNS